MKQIKKIFLYAKKAIYFSLVILAMVFVIAAANSTSAKSSNGNNGTVKIVEEGSDSKGTNANDPHVINFYVYGTNFDANQTGKWVIFQHPPTGRIEVLKGDYVANLNGMWKSEVLTLPAGHYKLDVDCVRKTEKHKVFWIKGNTVKPTVVDNLTPTPTAYKATPSATPTVIPTQTTAGVGQVLGVQLPNTGSHWIWISTVIGMFVLGGVLMAVDRRRGKI